MKKLLTVLLAVSVLILSLAASLFTAEGEPAMVTITLIDSYGKEYDISDSPESVSVKLQRNKMGEATVVFPYTDELSKYIESIGYAVIRVEMGTRTFYGTVEKISESDSSITLQCYDEMFFLDRSQRSFTQTTDDLTASMAFTNAFNDGSAFGYFTGVFTPYTTPFRGDIDAITHVEPVDSTVIFDDFFNGKDVTGIDFMNFLAKAGRKGDRYLYHYWFEYIDGAKYLFFQPDAWGEVHNNPVFTTATLEYDRNSVINNFHVYGMDRGGYYPKQDGWTEPTVDGWLYTAASATSSVTLSSNARDPLRVGGDYSIRAWHENLGLIGEWGRNVMDDDGDPVSLESMTRYYFRVYNDPDGGAPDVDPELQVWFYCTRYTAGAGISPDGFYTAWTNIPSGVWTTFDLTKASFNTSFAGDWKNVYAVVFRYRDNGGGTNLENDIYIDSLYIKLNPNKSENLAAISGYNATSAGTYGLREASLHYDWLKTVYDCNEIAETLVNYYSEPKWLSTMTMDYFFDCGLNEQVQATIKRRDLTLPIDSITWSLKNGQWKTTLGLGIAPLSYDDIISKHDLYFRYLNYQSGTQGYIF